MKRGLIKHIQIDVEDLKREKKDESLYFWEQLEVEIKKIWEEEETQEEKEKKTRELTFTEVVTEILYYHDPMDFAKYGFPEDEYDIEAYPIVYNLHRVDDLVSLRWMVYEVFAWKFSETSVPKSGDIVYKHIAAEIWDEWKFRIAKADAEREIERKKR